MLGRQISIRVTPAELRRLQREANSRSVTVSNYIRRAIYEYFSGGCELPEALFVEEAEERSVSTLTASEGTASAQPGVLTTPQARALGALAFARRDEKVAAAIAAQAERISLLREDVRIIAMMIDRSYFGFVVHTPEISERFRDASLLSGRRRHRAWRSAVKALHKARGNRDLLFDLEDEPNQDKLEGDDHGTQ
jgi:Mobilization protein NikA